MGLLVARQPSGLWCSTEAGSAYPFNEAPLLTLDAINCVSVGMKTKIPADENCFKSDDKFKKQQ